ncbi:hypothetical protein HY969_00790 [Candidatus Kaiserbacteria bacterium]|nr:hypothetical protein [Candidatus Kaiserbacteria bacterium]
MSGNRYSQTEKNAVEKLRKKGMTYAEIRAIHPIPKSTLSIWLGEKYPAFFDENARLEHLKSIRGLSAAKLRRDKMARDAVHASRGVTTAQKLPIENEEFQKALLSMLYWAEGTKHKATCALIFANTDPRLITLYLTMLRNCFDIDEKKIRVRLHLHYYHRKKETRRYWSKLLDVPETQFGKLWIKPRSKTKKFRQNFKGICIVKYGGVALLKEVLALGEAICDRIVSANAS